MGKYNTTQSTIYHYKSFYIFRSPVFYSNECTYKMGCDYKLLLEKRPDFLLAGERKNSGKNQGWGKNIKPEKSMLILY